MGLLNKLSNLIFEEEPSEDNKSKKTSSTQEKKGSWTDIFFEDVSEDSGENDSKPKKKGFFDFLYEEVPEEPDEGIKSTFVTGDEKTSVLNDISSKIERRESELINLAAFFKTVNPKDYPDSASEYEAYLSLVRQLNAIKELANSSQNSNVSSINNYQLESSFRKFELDYQTHIKAIQSLCYLSEISTLNSKMIELFSSNFTSQTGNKIFQTEGYIRLISKKSNSFDKKYSARLYKELIEAEYRLTLLKLMNELKNGRNPKKNPFANFSSEKKKTFETYISKDLRDSSEKYNTIADNKDKYIKYGFADQDFFYHLDSDAEIISERINKYSIDDFLLNELFENGEGFESLKRFLAFKLNLNYIDSKTLQADQMVLDDSYRRATSDRSTGYSGKSGRRTSSDAYKARPTKKGKKFPNFEDDL